MKGNVNAETDSPSTAIQKGLVQRAKLRGQKLPGDVSSSSSSSSSSHVTSSRGTRPKVSASKLSHANRVICPYCQTSVPNVKQLSEDVLLKYHQSQSRCYAHGTMTFDVPFESSFDDMPHMDFEQNLSDGFNSLVQDGFNKDEDDQEEDIKDGETEASRDSDNEGSIEEGSDENDDDAEDADEQYFETDEEVSFVSPEDTRKLNLTKYNVRHTQKYGEMLEEFDPFVLVPSDKIFLQQQRLHDTFIRDQGEVHFRHLSVGQSSAVDWKALLRIFNFGVSVGFSNAQGDEFLELLSTLIDRPSIELRKTWRSLKDAVYKQKVKQAYTMGSFKFRLPPELFGTQHWRSGKPLRPFRATAIDIRCILADIFLNLDPKQFITEFAVGEGTILREDQIISGFCTGDLFNRISKLMERFPRIDGLRVVPVLLGVWQDDTTLGPSRTTSECPIVLSVLNILGCGLHHLGFSPKHPPYSDYVLHKLLQVNGIKTKRHRVNRIVHFTYVCLTLINIFTFLG